MSFTVMKVWFHETGESRDVPKGVGIPGGVPPRLHSSLPLHMKVRKSWTEILRIKMVFKWALRTLSSVWYPTEVLGVPAPRVTERVRNRKTRDRVSS